MFDRTDRFYITVEADMMRSRWAKFLPARPIILTAMSFTRFMREPDVIPEVVIPEQIPEVAIDPGGFVAHMRGGYKFSWPAYLRWLFSIGPKLTWAALPDLPCEKALAPDALRLRARQERTLEYAHEVWGTIFESGTNKIDDTEGFEFRREFPWCWVTTIQGRSVDDYVWMAERLLPLLQAMDREYWTLASDPLIVSDADLFENFYEVQQNDHRAMMGARYARIGIGSLCAREKVVEVVDIVRAMHEILPFEQFHLWGVKLQALAALAKSGLLDCVASSDSAIWNGRERHHWRDIDKLRKSTCTACFYVLDQDDDADEAARLDCPRCGEEIGMKQQEYSVRVKLPEYLEKVGSIFEAPRAEGYQQVLL